MLADMVQFREETRTVVVIAPFANYALPGASQPHRSQLPSLDQVGPSVARLQALLDSERYRAENVETICLLPCLTRAEVRARLEELRQAVRPRAGLNLVLFWSGHGGLDGRAFRLATPDTYAPIEQEDGLGVDEVLREIGLARVGTYLRTSWARK